MKKIKLIISILVLCTLLSINTQVYAKYTYNEIQEVARFNIDRTAPIVEVKYIDYNDYIQVQITANEQIKQIEGWAINNENTVLTKEYYENVDEQIRVYDIAGNYTDTNVSINSLDAINIDVISIENTNTGYEKYANNSAEITAVIEINAKARLADRLDTDDIVIKLDGNNVENLSKELKWTVDDKTRYQYKLILKNIEGNGKLDIEVLEDSLRIITNEIDTTNKAYKYETGITVDNVIPNIETKQEQSENGKVYYLILGNEGIRARDEWDYSEDMLVISKEFPANASYPVTIMDFAGNAVEVQVDITEATYINLIYGSYHQKYGWSFAEKTGGIAGKETILAGMHNPTETLIFRLEGNVEPDFVQSRAYVYCYWQDTLGVCNITKNTYCWGYNPYNETWRHMNNSKLATINGKEYFQFAGAGINDEGQCDVNGEKPISASVAEVIPYGISAIKFKLKDYTEYSIIYQLHVDRYGWITPAYNEEECSMGYPSTISGIRIAILPHSEIQTVYDTWMEDRLTNNI